MSVESIIDLLLGGIVSGVGVHGLNTYRSSRERRKELEKAADAARRETRAAEISADKEIAIEQMGVDERFRQQLLEQLTKAFALIQDHENEMLGLRRQLSESESTRTMEATRCQQEVEIVRTELIAVRNRLHRVEEQVRKLGSEPVP